jgi:hypothetical protein
MKALAERYGAGSLVLVFGLNQLFNLRIMATTFKEGDPSYAGALGGVALGLRSYHIFELKDEIPEDVWEKEMSFKELEVEDELIAQISATMRDIREGNQTPPS